MLMSIVYNMGFEYSKSRMVGSTSEVAVQKRQSWDVGGAGWLLKNKFWRVDLVRMDSKVYPKEPRMGDDRVEVERESRAVQVNKEEVVWMSAEEAPTADREEVTYIKSRPSWLYYLLIIDAIC